MTPAPPVMTIVDTIKSNRGGRRDRRDKVSLRSRRALRLNGCSFRILQREPQFLRQRIHGRPRPLPLPLGFEAEIADAPAPRGDDAADGAEIAAVGMLLVE